VAAHPERLTTRRPHQAVAAAISRVRLAGDSDEVARALRAAVAAADSQPATPETVERLGEGWVAGEALAIAVYCALAATDFRSGVLLAVSHGGDSDSTGAICGNLLGAALGAGAIDPDLLAGLEGREVIEQGADDLLAVRESRGGRDG
jgi:ADP-ribosylglycohydrolase